MVEVVEKTQKPVATEFPVTIRTQMRNGARRDLLNFLDSLVAPGGFEPPTKGL